MLWGSRIFRSVFSILLFTLLTFSFPYPVTAKPAPVITLNFDIIAVKRDVSVTIRTKDFPIRTKFSVRMGTAVKKASDGVVVGEFNSDKGGAINQTFNIPDPLKGKLILGLRIESVDGYTAYNWFFNDTATTTLPDPKAKPSVDFSDAKKNTGVTVTATNLPANTAFWVRVGPYENFYSKYVFANTVKSDANGSLNFPVELPATAKDAEHVMVRIDGGGTYAYNVYQNVDGGKAVPQSQLYKIVECQILSLNPIPALAPRDDFDVIWAVQNTGLKDWEKEHVVFKFIGGTPMHKYQDVQTLPYTIKRGWVHEFVLDMRAPTEPGWYKAIWMVRQVANGDKDLCKLTVSVYVK